MKYFTELVRRHSGQRIVVMGGSPDLADHIKGLQADVWISVNDHGARLRAVDYVVAMDDVHTVKNVEMVPYIREVTDAPIIGPWRQNDYFLTRWPGSPAKGLSGFVAAWCAWAMGGHPVIMAGFNGYSGDQKMSKRSLKLAKLYDDYIVGAVRVIGSTLGNSWPTFRKGERFGEYKEHSSIRGLAGIDEEITIRVRKPVELHGQEWPPGSELKVARHEVRLQLKHRSVIEV